MTTIDTPTVITQDVAEATLWLFGHGDIRPGSFREALLNAIAKADPGNRMRLAESFPVECAAYTIASESPDGISILLAIAQAGK